jgi:tRNA-intron endonuclease
MPGELEEDSVFIRDVREASQTYSKGCFGYPLSGGFLELDLVEAAFLVQADRLEVRRKGKKLDFPKLFEYASSRTPGFVAKYQVYKDLRERGFIVKPESGAFDLRVYARGEHPSDSDPVYMVCAVSERGAVDIGGSAAEVEKTQDRGKQLLYGVVDEEGDTTYYKMSVNDPHGNVEAIGAPEAVGTIVGDRIFVFDPEAAEALHSKAFFGKPMEGVLQLSLIEGCYLVKKGGMKVVDRRGKELTAEGIKSIGRKNQNEFGLRLRAYEDLRERGLVVKTGFKYGTHFRVYEGSPDECHARYLVHAFQDSELAMWPEISRTVRLSGGVRKEILFCRVGEGIQYLEFKWFKP